MNLAKMTIDLIYSRIQATLTNTSHNTHTAKASRNETADQSAHIPPFCTIHPWKERFTNADVQHSPSYPLVSLSNTTTCFPTVGAMQGKSSLRTGRWAFLLVSAQKNGASTNVRAWPKPIWRSPDREKRCFCGRFVVAFDWTSRLFGSILLGTFVVKVC